MVLKTHEFMLESGNVDTYGVAIRRPESKMAAKMAAKYLSFNLDGLESQLIPLCMGYQGMQNHS